MSRQFPVVEAVRARAIELLGAGELGFVSDATSYANAKPPTVLIGIARRVDSTPAAVVIAVAASEYDGLAVASLLGFPAEPPKKSHYADKRA